MCVAHRVAVRAGGLGAETVPGHNTFLYDCALACLVPIDDEGQELSPAVMRHVFGVVERALAEGEQTHLLVVQRANVVRLAVVVPGEDLDPFWLDVEDLLPTVVPQITAGLSCQQQNFDTRGNRGRVVGTCSPLQSQFLLYPGRLV